MLFCFCFCFQSYCQFFPCLPDTFPTGPLGSSNSTIPAAFPRACSLRISVFSLSEHVVPLDLPELWNYLYLFSWDPFPMSEFHAFFLLDLFPCVGIVCSPVVSSVKEDMAESIRKAALTVSLLLSQTALVWTGCLCLPVVQRILKIPLTFSPWLPILYNPHFPLSWFIPSFG